MVVKATDKQLEYANRIAKGLNINLPKTDERSVIGAFIAKHKNEMDARQKEINTQIIREIESKIKIVDVASQMGYTLKREGWHYTIKEHDSVRIDVDRNLFIRYSNGHRGSVIDFISEFNNQPKNEVISELASKINLDYNFQASHSIQRKEKNQEEVPVLTLPEKGQNMKNIFAYLTQSRYLDSEIVQEMVEKKQLYQDQNRNCVFVSYKNQQPVFASLCGTNTFLKFKGDVKGCDYSQGWFVDYSSNYLYVTESPIDAMSKMSLMRMSNKNYHFFDQLSLSGVTKTEAVFEHLKEKKYKEIWVGVDADKAGADCYQEIKDKIKKEFPNVKVVRDETKFTKDWNDELKYLFSKGYRYENYINPNDMALKIMEEEMKALANADMKTAQETRNLLEQYGIPKEIEQYMLQYLEQHFDEAIQDFQSGSQNSIKKVVQNYNRKVNLRTSQDNSLKLKQEVEF